MIFNSILSLSPVLQSLAASESGKRGRRRNDYRQPRMFSSVFPHLAHTRTAPLSSIPTPPPLTPLSLTPLLFGSRRQSQSEESADQQHRRRNSTPGMTERTAEAFRAMHDDDDDDKKQLRSPNVGRGSGSGSGSGGGHARSRSVGNSGGLGAAGGQKTAQSPASAAANHRRRGSGTDAPHSARSASSSSRAAPLSRPIPASATASSSSSSYSGSKCAPKRLSLKRSHSAMDSSSSSSSALNHLFMPLMQHPPVCFSCHSAFRELPEPKAINGNAGIAGATSSAALHHQAASWSQPMRAASALSNSSSSSSSLLHPRSVHLILPSSLALQPTRVRLQVARIVDWMNEALGGLPPSPRANDSAPRILRDDEKLYVMVSAGRKKQVCAASIVKRIERAWKVEPRTAAANIKGGNGRREMVMDRSRSPMLHSNSSNSAVATSNHHLFASSPSTEQSLTQPLEEDEYSFLAPSSTADTKPLSSSSASTPSASTSIAASKLLPPNSEVSPLSVANFNSPLIRIRTTKGNKTLPTPAATAATADPASPSATESAAKRQKILTGTSASAASIASLTSPRARISSSSAAAAASSPSHIARSLSSPPPLASSSLQALRSPTSIQPLAIRASSSSPTVKAKTAAATASPALSLVTPPPLPLPLAVLPPPSSSTRIFYPALIGVEKILVAQKYRRQGCASTLMDFIRSAERRKEERKKIERKKTKRRKKK